MLEKKIASAGKITSYFISGFILYGICISIILNFIYGVLESTLSNIFTDNLFLLHNIVQSTLFIILYFFSIYIICRISLFDGFRKHYVLEENVRKLEKYITICLIVILLIFTCYYCSKISNSIKEYEMHSNTLIKLHSYSHSNSITDSLIQQKDLEDVIQQQTVALYIYFGIQLVGCVITYTCMIFLIKKYIAIYNVPYRKTKKAT